MAAGPWLARARGRATLTATMAALLCASAPALGNATSSPPPSRAHSAASVSVRDEGNLRFIRSAGSTLIDEGHASGTIPGNVRIHFLYNGNPNVSSQITIYGTHGTIQVRASGRLSSPTNPNPSFSGTL